MRRLLISNDDGIGSPFLSRFLQAFAGAAWDITAVLPASEQSWIGRSYSRHKTLELKEAESPHKNVRVFTVNGTPSDCVNIALGHLFDGAKPIAVVSGINIGQNIAMPLLWSSGTFAAAAEGAGWGLPAFAFSMQLASEYYEICRISHEPPPEKLDAILKKACAFSEKFVSDSLGQKIPFGRVFNVNFPMDYSEETPLKKCVPAKAKLCPLYTKNPDGNFEFKYAIDASAADAAVLTDMKCLKNGWASYSEIDLL
ncbi:MAG: 5'/3'-nucleotidase SurE [Opitutales bacterium]|nr:5'/3'-nucleotidase SurE [Opitutales bacterium]